MTAHTLVILDVQTKPFYQLSSTDANCLIRSVVAAIEEAQSSEAGIIICERDVANRGEVCTFVLDAIGDYKKFLRIEYCGKDAGEEVLSVIRQQGYERDRIMVGGMGDRVDVTKRKIECCSNYQIEVA